MRYGIFGDIHSNLEAFERVINAYQKERIDKYIFVGDVVGYGADPNRCIEELKKLNAESVCGNHDWAVVELFDIDYFNDEAKRAIEWTKKRLNKEEKEFLESLKLVNKKQSFSVVHASLERPEFFDYLISIESARECFKRMDENLCFVGHTHSPMVFFMDSNEIRYAFDRRIEIEPGVKYIINVGSVGQPRDNNPEACFCIYDSSEKVIEVKRVSYDVESSKDKILRAGLPAVTGYRLLGGQ